MSFTEHSESSTVFKHSQQLSAERNHPIHKYFHFAHKIKAFQFSYFPKTEAEATLLMNKSTAPV